MKVLVALIVAWVLWVSIAFGVLYFRQLPPPPTIHVASAPCDLLGDQPPLLAVPEHNYDYPVKRRRKGSTA